MSQFSAFNTTSKHATARVMLFFVALAACWLPFFAPSAWSFTALLDHLLTDPLVKRLAHDAASPRLLLIDIDEATLEAQGTWPWPRAKLADLVENTLNAGAQRVALDMVLPTPAPDPEGRVGDMRLATLANEGLLVPAIAFDFIPRAPALQIGAPSPQAQVTAAHALPATGYIGSHALIASNARCIGNVGFTPDHDGGLRRIPVRTRWQGHTYASLAESLVFCGTDYLAQSPSSPVYWPVPFRVSDQRWRIVSAQQVLNGHMNMTLPPNTLALIGSSALSLGDHVATPLSPQTAGFLIHAQVADALIKGDRFAPSRALQLSFMLISSLLISWLFFAAWRGNSFRGLLIPALGSVTLWLGSIVWMLQQGVMPYASGFLLGAIIWLLLAIPLAWASSQHKLAVRARILSRYVSNTVLNDLLQKNIADPLLPRRAYITVLFADLSNFTHHINTMPLEDAAQMTHVLMEHLSDPIWANQGTLDKYLGDGVLAFWGAPLPDPQQVEHALTTAKSMLEEISTLNQENRFPHLQIHIGIATGTAMVGDLGTRKRSTYSAIGDCVNLASRLQVIANAQGNAVLMCPETASHIGQEAVTEAGEVSVKGIGNLTAFTLRS